MTGEEKEIIQRYYKKLIEPSDEERKRYYDFAINRWVDNAGNVNFLYMREVLTKMIEELK